MKTIKDLKEIIKDLPDDVLIGGVGHFGEYLECYNLEVSDVYKYSKKSKITILNIEIEDAGEEPY